jgi:putative ABC transport system permease protein
MAQSVTQQRHEIGIGMALGASRRTVVGMATRSGLTLVGIGLLLGLPLAFLMLQGTTVTLNLFDIDLGFAYPAGLGGSLVVVAVLSTILPARRASAVAPVTALT